MLLSEKRFFSLLEGYEYVIIYGAGKVGRLVCEILKMDREISNLLCFAVTDMEGNPSSLMGVPIRPIEELTPYTERSIILIATLENLHPVIANRLETLHFSCVLPISKRLLDVFSQNYEKKHSIEYYLKNLPDRKIDSEMQKILFISTDNNRSSGAFLRLVDLCTIFQEKYMLELLVVLPGYGDGEDLLMARRIPFVVISSYDWVIRLEEKGKLQTCTRSAWRFVLNCGAIKAYMKLIKYGKFDIVHVNTVYSYVGAVAALFTKRRLIWHMREYLELGQNRTLWCQSCYRFLNKADKVIAISEAINKRYLTLVDHGRLLTVYDGISSEFYDPDKRIFEHDKVFFLMVGGLIPTKGQLELLKACLQLKKQEADCFELWILGKGEAEYTEVLHQFVTENHMEDQVLFFGMQEDVKDFYKRADIAFVCTSYEALGGVAIEAMLSGCLVIGADTGGPVELLRENRGLLYQQGNSGELADNITYALENISEMREIAARGRAYAKENLTNEISAEKVYKLYQSLKEGVK